MFEAGKKAKDLLEVAREAKPELFENPANLKNGNIVRWLIDWAARQADGYEKRAESAHKAHATKKRRKEEKERSAQAEQEAEERSKRHEEEVAELWGSGEVEDNNIV